jgi:hypothetical protein
MGEPCVEGCYPCFNSELSRDVDDVWRRASPRERLGHHEPGGARLGGLLGSLRELRARIGV